MSRLSDRALVEAALPKLQRTRGGWMRGPCPFCLLRFVKDDKKRAFGLNVRTTRYHCFRCGTAGYLDIDLKPINIGRYVWETDEDDVADVPAVSADGAPAVTPKPEREKPPYLMALGSEPGLSARSLERAREYLRERNLEEDLWELLQVGVCTDGWVKNRVVIPVLDLDGETWLGWVARTFVGADPPYFNKPGQWRRTTMFNRAALYAEKRKPVFLTEGVFDALALWPDGVATLGKELSPEQRNMLLECRRRIVVTLDGDAWEQAEALALWLRLNGKTAVHIQLPAKKDPATMPGGVDAIYALARAALADEESHARPKPKARTQ